MNHAERTPSAVRTRPTAADPDDPTTAGPDRRPGREWIGLVLGPTVGALLYFLLPASPGLTPEGRTTAALVASIAVWWMTEALPLSATALVPIVVFPLAGVLELGDVTAAYGNPTIFLFLGGFAIALAMQKWNLHSRIALSTVRVVGTNPGRLVLGVMVATAFLSMWVSNTATALMMIPIGISVLALVDRQSGGTLARGDVQHFGASLMLAIAYAATIGGLATLVGSPPNLVLAGLARTSLGVDISFAGWMAVGVPISIVMLVLAWLLLTKVQYRPRIGEIAGGKQVISEELAKLGRISAGEWTVAIVFVVTAGLWVSRSWLADWTALTDVAPFVTLLTDGGIAVAALVALFLVPVKGNGGRGALDWGTLQKGVPWGVLILFGGGLAIAESVQSSGLDTYIGESFSGLGTLPTILLVAAVALIILALTELTSNTATAATFLPVIAGVAGGIGVDPLLLLVPAAFAATCSFMLPVGTPPNAIVFGTGRVTMGQMVASGVWLNLLAVLVLTLAVYALGPWALGIGS
ncbi:DASS family sodium-coupled anion symporter [Kineococcus sp. TBRC 1896]|uniref:Sodium-dependent dicarboxylate transporter SdcS n=1 Tax=Kineococcus mangrovi TaxID=1660183 RepID=A0ABV4I6I4_9ACTN